MLVFFTDPYPDELLYSAISRYHYYIGNYSNQDTFKDIYGWNKQKISEAIKYFGINLDYLVKELSGTYNVDELINNHTLFPLYKPFFKEEDVTGVISSMINGDASPVNLSLINKLNNENKLYYCTKCAREDIDKYDQPYFHRIHQLKGISVCPLHKLPLKQYSEGIGSNQLIRIDKSKIDLKGELVIVDETYSKSCKISELSYELLTKDISLINKQKLCKYYKTVLNKKGFLSKSGNVKQKILKEELINYYGEVFLERFDSRIDMNVKLSWTDYLFENRSFVHPINHLLLINFLGKNFSEIIDDIDKDYYPYGKGPWPCMNKLCKHYKKDVINDIIIKKNTAYKNQIGIFECKICGLSYSRFLSTEKDDKYDVWKIIDYGALWTDILTGYLNNGQYSIYEISKMMECSYNTIYNTKQLNIKKYKEIKIVNNKLLKKSKEVLINELKINPNILKKDLKELHSKEYSYISNYDSDWLKTLPCKHNRYKSSEEKLNLYKKEVLEIMHENPNTTRTKLFEKVNMRSYYIKKHDPIWWEENVQALQSTKNKSFATVDWQKRDAELLKSLKNKFTEIMNRNEVTKITFSFLQKEIHGIPLYYYSIGKMPKSKTYIEGILDTKQSYLIKCYKKFIEKQLEDDINFTINEIPKDYFYFYKQDKSIRKELEDYISTLKSKQKIL